MPLTSKEKSAIWRAKIKANPELHHAYLEKEKKRREDRKATGKLKLVDELSARDRRAINKKWRKQQQDCRQRKKDQLNSPAEPLGSPQLSETSGLSLTSISAKVRGRKKVVGAKAKVYRENTKLKEKLEVMTTQRNKYKQRLFRIQGKSKNKSNSNTPNSKTKVMLKNCRVGTPVRRTLLFHNVLVDGLGSLIKDPNKAAAVKQSIHRIISAKRLASYRLLRLAQGYLNCSRNFLASRVGHRKRPNAVTTDVVQKVVDFYERDDVSRMTSGKKQCITRRKRKKQKRYLNDTMKNLHLKFLCENAEIKLSYTMFCKFRPFWVVAPAVDDRETCMCQTCHNLEFMAGKLLFHGVINTRTLGILSKQLTCKGAAAKTCMYRECHDCVNKRIERQSAVNYGQLVTWNLWKSRTESRVRRVKDKDEEFTVKIIVKDLVTGTIEQLIDDFEAELKKRGCRHLYNIEHQFLAIHKMKRNIKSDEAALHIDFAENYVCKLSSEVQSMHFGASKGQVTMHNGVLYLQDRKFAFSTLSPSTRHDPVAIWAYLSPVIDWVLALVPNLRVLRFISDSPATQYRCKKNFHFFCNQLFEVCPPTFQLGSWDYSEAGHGKGAADGVGALLKRTADRFVAQGRDLPDAAAVFEALVDPRLNLSVKLFLVKSQEISDMELLLPANLKTLSGTMSVHQICTRTKGEITFRPLSCYCRVECDPFPCECYSPGTMVYDATTRTPPQEASPQLPPEQCHLPQDSTTNAQLLHEPSDVPLSVQSPVDHQTLPVLNLLLPIEEPSDEHIGKFCVVKYSGRPYPGKIISVNLLDGDIEVSCMATVRGPRGSIANHFFWPNTPDICFYELPNIISLIDEPKAIGLHSRHCALEESVWAAILLKLGL